MFKSVSVTLVLMITGVTFFSFTATGQPTIGILPVSSTAVSNDLLNNQQMQWLTSQMQNYFVTQLKTKGKITTLTREHILLLMKEVPSPDPEALTAEAYKIISKKGRLGYLIRCSIEAVEHSDNLVRMPLHVIVVEGNSGKILYEDDAAGEITLTTPLTEHILLNKVFKPSVAEILKQIKALEL